MCLCTDNFTAHCFMDHLYCFRDRPISLPATKCFPVHVILNLGHIEIVVGELIVRKYIDSSRVRTHYPPPANW